MNWALFLKYLGYAFIISVYGVFAWVGKAPVEGFIAVLMGVLATLGASHVAASAAKAATDAATQTNAPVTPTPVDPLILPTTVNK
jgi:hypothetical protein